MRVVAGLAGLLLLAGCEGIVEPIDSGGKEDGVTSTAAAAAFASTGSPFDYRYAYRLPASKVKAVLQSNADGCDKLGPARCRILSMRYKVEGSNIRAVLTFKIDPVIARGFGEAATRVVTSADGVLVDTEVNGADTTAAARSLALINRLREQLANAEAGSARGGAEGAASRARASRIRSALETIAEVEAGTGQTLATAPVLMTYESSSALNGGLGASADANFRNAGQTLVSSIASLAQVLAGVGPWLLLMIAAVFLLRWFIHGRGDAEPLAAPAAPEPEPEDRNMIQRWFARDEDEKPAQG